MLIEAMVGGVVLAITVATVFTGLTQSSHSTGRALRAQRALEIAQVQYDRLRNRPISHAHWTVPTSGPTVVDCPDTLRPADPADPLKLRLPNNQWRCTLEVTRTGDTFTTPPLPFSTAYRRARIRVAYTSSLTSLTETEVVLELLKCERC